MLISPAFWLYFEVRLPCSPRRLRLLCNDRSETGRLASALSVNDAALLQHILERRRVWRGGFTSISSCSLTASPIR